MVGYCLKDRLNRDADGRTLRADYLKQIVGCERAREYKPATGAENGQANNVPARRMEQREHLDGGVVFRNLKIEHLDKLVIEK